MSPEARPHTRTEPTVHPRQMVLLERLQRPSLPQGADELIRQAIAEYDSAFGKPRVKKDGKAMVESTVRIDFPGDDNDGVILAGENHLLTVGFTGAEGKASLSEDMHTYLPVTVLFKDPERESILLKDVNIYPDWVRYIPLDINGNSEDAKFLIEIPDSLREHNGLIEVSVFSGARLFYSKSTSLQFQ